MRDNSRMNLIRVLFRVAILIFCVAFLSTPGWADTNDEVQAQISLSPLNGQANTNSTHHSAMAILTSLKSDFAGIVFSMSGLFLFGRAISLLAERGETRSKVTAIPAQVPPLRPSISRVTTF